MNPADGIQTLTPAMARHRFFASGAASERMFKPNFDQFGIARITDFAPLLKTPLPPARSTIPLIMWLTAGQFDIQVGVQLWPLKPGAVVFIAARQIFSISGILPGSTGYVCMFDEQFLARHTGKSLADFPIGKLITEPMFALPDAANAAVHFLFDRIFAEYDTSGIARTDLIPAYLLALLTELSRAYSETTPVPQLRTASQRLTDRFRQLLTEHILTDHRVAEYANRLNVSPNHLNKAVRSVTGLSPTVWIDHTAVLEAQAMLFQSGLSIGQVAAELGFDDPSSFGKLFRKYTGQTPGNFRRMIETDEFSPEITC